MILDLATYKQLTGTTTTTNDSFINAQIPPTQDLIERYCDRHFDLATYSEWIHCADRELILDEYPINKVMMVGSQVKVAELTWAATEDLAVEVKSDSVIVTDTGTYGFPSDTYTYNVQTTLDALRIELGDDWGIVVTIEPGYATLPSALLKTGNGKTWYGAKRIDCNYRIQDFSLRYIEEEDSLNYAAWADMWFTNSFYVLYQAGYTSATMPKGLQLAMSNIIKDLVGIKDLGSKGLLKSEQIKNYSYTNWSPTEFDIKNIVDNYTINLEPYKKKSI